MGEGVSEMRIHYGPGYRVYFVQRGEALIVLLAGGDKDTQDRDIRRAIAMAREFQEAAMGKLKTLPWDPAQHIETEEDMALSLSVALEDDDPRLLLATLNDIARAKQSLDGARSAGPLADELPLDGKTDIATVLKAVRELGLQLHAKVAADSKP